MSKWLCMFMFMFVVATSILGAEDQGTITVQNGSSPAGDVDIFVFVNQGKQPAGTTDSQGTLPFDVSLLAGKVRGDAYVQECSSGVRLILVAEGEDYDCDQDTADESCECRRAGAWFFSDGSLAVDLSSSGASSIARNPLVIGAVAGGVISTVVIVGGGDDDDTPLTSSTTTSTDINTTAGSTSAPPPPATTTPSATSLNGRYPGTFRLERDECNFFVSRFNGTAVVDANAAGSLTLQIIENITRTYRGSLMMTGSGDAVGQGTGNGAIGNNAFTGTAALTFENGRLSVIETIRLTDRNNCAAEFRATNLSRQP